MHSPFPIRPIRSPTDPGDLPDWVAAMTCLGAAALALIFMLVPGVVAPRPGLGPLGRAIATGTVGFVAAALLYPLYVRTIGLSPVAVFIGRPTRDSLLWGLVGASIGGTLVGIALLLGETSASVGELSASAVLLHVSAGLAVGLWTGTLEELFLRGVVLAVIGHRWNWPGAIVTTALVFGVLHHGAADTAVATALYVSVTAVAGLLFGAVTVVTGSVWNAVVLHAAWNTLFNEFVIATDGTAEDPLVLVAVDSSSPLLSAGEGTLTESPLSLLLFVLACAATWWRLRQWTEPPLLEPP